VRAALANNAGIAKLMPESAFDALSSRRKAKAATAASFCSANDRGEEPGERRGEVCAFPRERKPSSPFEWRGPNVYTLEMRIHDRVCVWEKWGSGTSMQEMEESPEDVLPPFPSSFTGRK